MNTTVDTVVENVDTDALEHHQVTQATHYTREDGTPVEFSWTTYSTHRDAPGEKVEQVHIKIAVPLVHELIALKRKPKFTMHNQAYPYIVYEEKVLQFMQHSLYNIVRRWVAKGWTSYHLADTHFPESLDKFVNKLVVQMGGDRALIKQGRALLRERIQLYFTRLVEKNPSQPIDSKISERSGRRCTTRRIVCHSLRADSRTDVAF